MFEFTVQHKYCGMIKQVKGHNIWDAFKNEGLELNVWICRAIEPIV